MKVRFTADPFDSTSPRRIPESIVSKIRKNLLEPLQEYLPKSDPYGSTGLSNLLSFNEKQAHREMMGVPPIPKIHQLIDVAMTRQSNLQHLSETVGSMPNIVGQVTLTSGNSLARNIIMVWAFIELNKN